MADDLDDEFDNPSPETLREPTAEENKITREAVKRFKKCVEWEVEARTRFDYDYKFANGDAHNKYQWDDVLVLSRENEQRPVLTVNKTQQHNLLIINDAKQNKPGVRIRPVGDEGTYEAAKIFQELIYHTEYVSNAENIYDSGVKWAVEAGIGYWRIVTDYLNEDTFDQEIYIRHIKDPRSVYLDPDINEIDGSDARFGFVFEDIPNDLFREKYPKFAGLCGRKTLMAMDDEQGDWLSSEHVRVADYFRKVQKKDKLVTFVRPNGSGQVISRVSKLSDEDRDFYQYIRRTKDERIRYMYQERNIVSNDMEWIKLAANRVISKAAWLGKYVPIVRLPGVETIIDGRLDRKGHTRTLLDPQRIYNYNTSANVEYGALQTKVPWLASSDSVENFEEYYKTANSINHSYLPYNAYDEEGRQLPPPSRPNAPQPSPAYVQQLQIAQNEMMMASGQYQSQFGENENAKSGVAINARQRQGDRATYHFIDNQAIAIRFTGKILLDLYPKIYDTERVMQIRAVDGSYMNVQIDPNAQQAVQELQNPNPIMVDGQKVKELVFNPNVGMYAIQSDTGPSFATRRQEAFNALTQLAAQNPKFMEVAGDVFFKVADFPEADILQQRFARMIPPNLRGEGPDPQIEQMLNTAADKIQHLQSALVQMSRQLADKDKDLDLKAANTEINYKKAVSDANREDYEAETTRLTAIGNAGPALDPMQTQDIFRQLMAGMLNAGEPGAGDKWLAGLGKPKLPTNADPDQTSEATEGSGKASEPEETPPMEGAQKAPDGQWYVPNPEGGYMRVEANG